MAVMVTVWPDSLAGPGLTPLKLTVWVAAFSKIVKLVNALRVGGWLTALTVSTNVLLELTMPSLTVSVMVDVPKALVSGVIVAVRLLSLPPKTMLLVGTRLAFEDAAERMSAEEGVSASPIIKAIGPVGVFSSVLWGAMAEMVGRPF